MQTFGNGEVGTKKVKILENYMVIEFGDNLERQTGFKSMDQIWNFIKENDIKKYEIYNVAKTKIKILVRKEG
jgi:hypothetical protein